jgi:hypothetical protein
MSNIPEDIKSLINDKADKYGFRVPYDGSNKFYNDDRVKGFQAGAEFGYSLPSEAIEKKDKEIERLKKMVESQFYGSMIDYGLSAKRERELWDDFKKENNL